MPLNPEGTYAVTVSTANSVAVGLSVTTFHLTSLALNDAPTVNTFIGHLKTFFTSLAASVIPSSQTYIIGSTVVTMADPPAIIGATTQSVTGTTTGGSAPPQVALIASWKTAHAGRSYRGRNYIGPVATTALGTTGAFQPAVVSTLQTAMNTLIANVATMSSTSSMVVWSKKNHDGDFILSGVARGRTGTMRTRN